MADRAVIVLYRDLPLIREADGMLPKPVGDLLFLQRLYNHARQGADSGLTLPEAIRHIAAVVGLGVKKLDWDVGLGMNHEKVAPQSGEFRITIDEALDDCLNDPRLSSSAALLL
ncbi:hypothetical protein X771_32075 [Mesorhizobium sp. LSJC277A00]|nr:hypothetical protein X771_32075 [Mesorhizobium sp. LSJC277A00]